MTLNPFEMDLSQAPAKSAKRAELEGAAFAIQGMARLEQLANCEVTP